MNYRRCGNSGILLPEIALGLWHNFGEIDNYENCREMIFRSFDLGITHFDLANNYGPPPGSAETTFGRILKADMHNHRDEMIISSKAGYTMWDGPYGDWGSRKYLIASLDQSLKRMGLDYVDIFYHHRPDPQTPLEETMGALDHIVRSGKALYVGLSNYSAEQFNEAVAILNRLGTPCLIEQSKYSMFVRKPEEGLLDALEQSRVGMIAFSPLAQGMLSDRYLHGIPADSRAARGHFLKSVDITEERLATIAALNGFARDMGMSLAQMATKWLLRDHRVTSVLIGASRVAQIEELVAVATFESLSADSLTQIEEILNG
ncbi:MAG: aldo/keto reductase [Rikenellaceae bacterium]